MRRGTSVLAYAVITMTVSTLATPATQAPPSAVPERDPFTPPAAPSRMGPGTARLRQVETRLSDLALDSVGLTGVACSHARQAAVLRSPSGRAWVIAAGDRLRDARVARVTCDAVLFELASPKRSEGGRSGEVRASREVWRYLRRRLVSPKQSGGEPVSPKRSEEGEEAR